MPAPAAPQTATSTTTTRDRARAGGARVQTLASRYPLALIVLGVCLYSTGPVFVQASSVSGPVFSFWRLLLGVPVLGLATLVGLRSGGRMPDRRALRWPLWAGLGFGLHQLLFFSAIKLTSVTDVSLMNTLAPILVAVAAVPLFGERPGRGFAGWTLIAIVGAAVVILGASSGPGGSLPGMLMAVANVIAFGAFFLVSKASRDHIDVLPFLLGTMTIAAATVSVYVVTLGEPVTTVQPRDLLYALAVAAGPGAIGHFVMTWPLRWVPANIPPVIRLAQPLIAGALAWWFLGEPVTAAHLAGGALTLGGVCGAVLSKSGRELSAQARDQAATQTRDPHTVHVD